ncbi:MAG: dTDP-4-dehydrorhamnose reductase [Verrucomicrobia bacterium]|nr:MAG: dTDP-4-dehydrorhamnose reductase [Verrucomicrobiota bacterium]
MSQRILLIGKNGQVGWELRRTLAPLGQIICTGSADLDLSNTDAIRQFVRQSEPEIIVNAAAYTAVDKAEAEPEMAGKINGEAPEVLARECARAGALLIHYSTDYVFDGTKNRPYVETDEPNPLNVYGKTKLLGEQSIRATDCAHLIFRLCWVYGGRGQNFMLTMIRLARGQQPLRVVNDQVGCPTWSRLIAETTALALKQLLAATDKAVLYGTYHLAAAGQTSWFDFAKVIVELHNQRFKTHKVVYPITTAEFPRPARRPAYSVLDGGKLRRTFGLQLPQWKESLELVLEPPPQRKKETQT